MIPAESQSGETHTESWVISFIKVICLLRDRSSPLHEVIFWTLLIIIALDRFLNDKGFRELLSLQVVLCMRKITQWHGFTNGSIQSDDMIIIPGSTHRSTEQMPH